MDEIIRSIYELRSAARTLLSGAPRRAARWRIFQGAEKDTCEHEEKKDTLTNNVTMNETERGYQLCLKTYSLLCTPSPNCSAFVGNLTISLCELDSAANLKITNGGLDTSRKTKEIKEKN